MMAAAMAVRTRTDLDEAERLLTEWGLSCRQNAERLGMPVSSGIHRMIERVKVFEQQRKDVTKKRRNRRKQSRVECRNCGHRYPSLMRLCSKCGTERRTADGAETVSFRPMTIQISSTAAQVDVVVAKLPGWMKKCIDRRYRYGQPDKKAAQDLRMSKERYREQCEAAVERVAELLAARVWKP